MPAARVIGGAGSGAAKLLPIIALSTVVLSGIVLISASRARASEAPEALEVDLGAPGDLPGTPRVLAVDADDDDEDGRFDASQSDRVPLDDARPLRIRSGGAAVVLRVEGPLRLLRKGSPLPLPAKLNAREMEGPLHVQGTRAARDAALIIEGADRRVRVPIAVVAVSLLDARNRPIEATHDAVGVAHVVTNDGSLPRGLAYRDTSPDPDNVRIEVHDPTARDSTAEASIESVDPHAGSVRAALSAVPLSRPGPGQPFRSPWLRLVSDDIDARAPGVGGRVLRTHLRDVVRVRYRTSGGTATQSVRFGRPGDERGPKAARRAQLRIRVLRRRPGGAAVVGEGDATAERLARDQIAIANEIWAQCFVGFGRPEDADVRIVDPPPPTLLTIADGDGFPAAGGGHIRLLADGRPVGPVPTRSGDPPVATALAVAGALREAGLSARVTENAPTEFGAGRSADVLVRSRGGGFVTLAPDGPTPLSTDRRQAVLVGRVDLGDGLQEFDNMIALAGTLEERALLKALMDDDPATIDLIVVNGFTTGTRQGEAFIEGGGGSIVNAVILDRNGLRQQRAAWTQSHEVGHVLLDQPYHPDNVGADRPWLLMDADTSLPLVTGPKRLRWEDCHRVRSVSGIDAVPALLAPMDARAKPPSHVERDYDRGVPSP